MPCGFWCVMPKYRVNKWFLITLGVFLLGSQASRIFFLSAPSSSPTLDAGVKGPNLFTKTNVNLMEKTSVAQHKLFLLLLILYAIRVNLQFSEDFGWFEKHFRVQPELIGGWISRFVYEKSWYHQMDCVALTQSSTSRKNESCVNKTCRWLLLLLLLPTSQLPMSHRKKRWCFNNSNFFAVAQ